MIRPDYQVGLADLLASAERSAERAAAGPAGPPDAADDATSAPAARRSWRNGWPALLASSTARAVLALLFGLLVWSTAPALPGWHPTVVQTGSMRPLLQPGDVVIARPVNPARLQPGQVLLVTDPDHPDRLRLHRLVRFSPAGRLVLRGDANRAEDSSTVAPGAVRGVAVLRVPGIGLPMLWARQGQYGALAVTGLLLLGLLAVAGAYQAADRRPAPPGRLPPPGSAGPRRARFGRVAAVSMLAGLAVLQLAHPTPARASYRTSTANPTGRWTAIPYYSCRQAVLASSPMLYYRLDETAGSTTAADSSSSGANATYSSSGIGFQQPGACPYDAGHSIALDGGSGYLYLNVQTAAPSTFSLELWFASTAKNGGWLMGLGSATSGLSSTADRMLYLAGNGKVGFGMLSAGSKQAIFSDPGFNDGSWHLADATFSPGTGMRLYLDGQLVASNTAVTSGQSYNGYLRVGFDSLAGWPQAPKSNYYAGNLDEISAYTTVLTASQVSAHYLAG